MKKKQHEQNSEERASYTKDTRSKTTYESDTQFKPHTTFFGLSVKKGIVLCVCLTLLVFWHISLRSAPIVLLSFDVEEPDSTQDITVILEILARHDATATFFITGKTAELHHGWVEMITTAGHEIGCHTHSHPRLTRLDFSAQDDEIHGCEEVVKSQGVSVKGFRAPYNAVDKNTYDIIGAGQYVYDASQIENYPFYPFVPQGSDLRVIKVSALGFLPLSDAILIYAPFPRIFFFLMRLERGDVSLLFHPHRIAQYSEQLDKVLSSYASHGARFVSHEEYATEK
jgi:peptidoglycan/xylan/chitin deacetylase (PgdA/CDA1 family)